MAIPKVHYAHYTIYGDFRRLNPKWALCNSKVGNITTTDLQKVTCCSCLRSIEYNLKGIIDLLVKANRVGILSKTSYDELWHRAEVELVMKG